MTAKRFAVATLVGALAVLATGYVIFWLAFGDFYGYAMSAGSVNVARERPVLWALVLGTLSYTALITLAIGSRADPVNLAGGIKIGAVLSFLLWLTADLMLYAVSTVGNVTTTFVDALLETIPGAIAGGAIAVSLRKTG